MVYRRIVARAPLCCVVSACGRMDRARELLGDRVLILGVLHPYIVLRGKGLIPKLLRVRIN